MKFLSQHPIVVLVVFYFLFFWCPQFLFTFGVPVKDLPGNTLAHDFLVRVWQIHSCIFLQIWIRILLPTFAFMDIYWCNIIAFLQTQFEKIFDKVFYRRLFYYLRLCQTQHSFFLSNFSETCLSSIKAWKRGFHKVNIGKPTAYFTD